MVVQRVELRDFRNYARAEVDLGPGLNVVHGPNGAGKTNLLEAVYFGLTARSCRTSNEREVVRIGAPLGRVVCDVAGDDGAHQLEVGFAPGEEKRVRVDGSPPDRQAPPPRPLVCVFLPDRLDLIKGAPATRRAHLDQVVAALWPSRSSTRAAYARTLAQRNALIGRIRRHQSSGDALDAWDAELARHGEQLMADRRRAIEALAEAFSTRAADLGLPEAATLRYEPRSKSRGAAGLRGELIERRQSDIERGFTTHGPHRDEVGLLHGERPLRNFGSQGQQRLGLLALLFAERDVLGARGSPPLMLLDDVMSELDSTRRELLSDLVRQGGQAIVTSTDLEHVPGAERVEVTTCAVLAGTVTTTPRAVAA